MTKFTPLTLTAGHTTSHTIRPPLEKMLCLVQRPGESMRADWDLFFFIFNKKKIFNNIFTIFLPNKKEKGGKKIVAAARLPIISATRCTGNKLFFKGGPSPTPADTRPEPH